MKQQSTHRLQDAINRVLPILKRSVDTDHEHEIAIEILDALGFDEDEIQATFSDYFYEIELATLENQHQYDNSNYNHTAI